jgi:hypothetical protein
MGVSMTQNESQQPSKSWTQGEEGKWSHAVEASTRERKKQINDRAPQECGVSIDCNEEIKGVGPRYNGSVASELEYRCSEGWDIRSKNQSIQDIHQSDSRH